ncbi:DNA-3-methyladenine glycosylase [Brevibacillus formosus]|uniref:DNA-3-methyladenine glycosylase family protein n=1 Tax=Brevibacillus TaxID=55080 RepID=UPI000D1079FD|nr:MULTISPECIES: DNA-3-methyladenine glycosylase [Brevibacillus]MBG9941392.1 DNA-3-methyladenine glycosylase [Brevibacillus formosus]MED1948851.1 DNA-3-methyladenine glycosylase [Brevibacillus formosus]MED2001374.1 DNA-3-methyladenine glycosylase [Brevibacillus formosus]MED2085459.1 DNA-3-methyladenine glycosylase [Brevibacillus formosus]PSK21755.1 DNA-3-methyladenine glycosylase [Brevibacillus sp. NRRL NRS-603]
MNCWIISLTPPYSFDRLLRRLETHPDTQIRVNKEKNSLQRVFRIGLRPVLVHMQFMGSLEEPALRYETQATLSRTDQQLLEKMIRRTFSADLDLSVIYEQMREESELAILTERFRGLRLTLDADLFQCMVKTIIGQQINLTFAANLTERLVTLAGDPVENQNGEGIIAFPTPDAVARLTVEDLRTLQFSQRKAEYIIDFARAIVNETVDLERLWTMKDEEIITYLTSLRGIGRWTVECLLMFGMGRPDLLPAADIGLRNGIIHLYRMETKPNENDIRKLGEKWAPWRSIYCLYVWEAVGAIKRKEIFEL